MKSVKIQKFKILYIAALSVVDRYPARYQRDTAEYPFFIQHLQHLDDIFVVNDIDKKTFDEDEFITADVFFELYPVNRIAVEFDENDVDFVDLWRLKNSCTSMQYAARLMIPNSGQQKRLEGK